ncbi:SAM-dependent methyltransferase [Amycolatopsis minnesotensis]|uniref:27-O-demethylrifamycin SV methyltransferase n=1 Tax=Amycolatopsis minnesotensis TaxID=337894 RepID=A0ABN2QKV7_9PSEU
MSDTIDQAGEDVGAYYDDLTEFTRLTFGDSIHMGLWSENDTSSITEAQDRMTRFIGDVTGLTGGQRLLDVGYGNGRPVVLYAESAPVEVTAVDVSEKQLDHANAFAAERGVADRVSFSVGDAMKLPFEDDSFDAAWALECFSHMTDRGSAMREIKRVLRPGGRLILSDVVELSPLATDDKDLLFTCWMMSSLFDLPRYHETVRDAGLTIVEEHDITDKVRTTLDHVGENYLGNRPAIVARYGEEFASEVDDDFPKLGRIQRDHLGYVVMVVRKPE